MRAFTKRLRSPYDIKATLAFVAWLHALGKANPRFQQLLRDGSEIALLKDMRKCPKDWRLAKSGISGCELGLAKDTNKAAETNGKDEAAETVLCAANRGSQQKMFATMRDLRSLVVEQSEIADAEPKLVTASHLRRALTELWRFDDIAPKAVTAWLRDRKPTLRWDEGAERLHALRLHDPTKDPEPFSTQFGGYSLAASALPCFQTFPAKRGALTSFSLREKNAKEVAFLWPLWDTPATLATIQAMHLSGEAQRHPKSARARGVYRLMRATRQTQDKGKLTFQSAEAVW